MHCRSQLMQHRRRSFPGDQVRKSGLGCWRLRRILRSPLFLSFDHLTYDRYWSADSSPQRSGEPGYPVFTPQKVVWEALPVNSMVEQV